MANPLFDMYANQAQPQMPQMPVMPNMTNPMQRAAYMMEAMRNPAAFVRNVFPNMPREISNDANRVLQWMQQNLGVTQQDIRNVQNQIPR